MMSKGLLAVLLLVLSGLLLADVLLRPDPRERNFEVFTEMAYTQAGKSQSLHAAMPGGVTGQALQEGVVVRGRERFRYGPGPEEALRAGAELVNPAMPQPGLGAELFKSFCVACHAADGSGTGPVVQRGMLPPPSLLGGRARQMADGEMFHALTRGQGAMASFALQLSPAERWQVIHHVRTLQEEPR